MTDLALPAARKPSLSERIEGAAAIALMALFKALPIDAASAVGGFLARSIGPRLGITKRARRNLELAMPELSAAERHRVIVRMWDNLGRVIAELPHVEHIQCFVPGTRIEVVGVELQHMSIRVRSLRIIGWVEYCGALGGLAETVPCSEVIRRSVGLGL